MVRAHALSPFADLIGYFFRSADSDKERFADGLEIESAVHFVRACSANLQLLHRKISRRREPLRRAASVIFKESLQMDRILPLGFFLCLRDVNKVQERQLVRSNRVSVMGSTLAQPLIQLLSSLFRNENRRIAEAEFSSKFDGFRTAGSNDVTGRMRLLIRPRPRIQEAISIEISIVRRRAVGSPCLQHDLE